MKKYIRKRIEIHGQGFQIKDNGLQSGLTEIRLSQGIHSPKF